jgi:polyisoprenyl-teichoic acid--peptidoglycan teichoic acid transferase
MKRAWAVVGGAGLIAWVVSGALAADPPPARAGQPSLNLGRAVDAVFSPAAPDRLFILAIGSDARPGQSVARARADSLHIIGVNPQKRSASILGIPRDAFVPIPGAGTQKINASLFHGGPELTVRTVEQLTGIQMDAYVLAGFEDFRRMVTTLGGLEVRVPYPMSDSFSGANFRAGPTRMTGPEALAFARNRHDAPGGDFGRSLNQGTLILSALRELLQDYEKDPVTLLRWTVAGGRYLITDLTFDRTLDLLLAALAIDPDRVRNRVVSGGGGTVGGASVVHLGSSAQAMFRDLRQDASLGG